MIIRKIRANERYKATLTASVAFEGQMDYPKEELEALNMTEEAIIKADEIPQPQEPYLPSDSFRSEKWGALEDDDSTVMGSMSVIPYTVRFDGNDVLMGGIGGVATIPTYRRRGCIRGIFGEVFRDLNEKGFALSHLYPFSHAYYRKFGYETGAIVNKYEIDFKAIKKYDSEGYAEFVTPGADISELGEIYHEFYKNHNLSGVRKTYNGELSNPMLLNEGRYIYIWRNKQGEATGFMIFRKDNRIMDCTNRFGLRNDFLFLDTDALRGLLDFAATMFVPNYTGIRIWLPSDIRLDLALNEANNVESSTQHNGMTRVINAEKVLSVCNCRGEGTVSIKIRDDMAPWNDGTWSLSFAQNTQNTVVKSNAEADIEMDIAAFTSLICGYCEYDDISLMDNVKVYKENPALKNVFYRKKAIATDLF